MSDRERRIERIRKLAHIPDFAAELAKIEVMTDGQYDKYVKDALVSAARRMTK